MLLLRKDIYILLFSGVDLYIGYLYDGVEEITCNAEVRVGSSSRGEVQKKKKTEEYDRWNARESHECMLEAEDLKKQLVRALETRQKLIHPSLDKLSKCVDLFEIISLLTGNRAVTQSGIPYDEVSLMEYGEIEFRHLVGFMAEIPHFCNHDSLRFHPSLASKYFGAFKNGIVSLIWGDLFSTVGSRLFEIVDGPQKGKKIVDLKGESRIDCFSIDCSFEGFILESFFIIKLNISELSFRTRFLEEQL